MKACMTPQQHARGALRRRYAMRRRMRARDAAALRAPCTAAGRRSQLRLGRLADGQQLHLRGKCHVSGGCGPQCEACARERLSRVTLRYALPREAGRTVKIRVAPPGILGGEPLAP